MVKIRSKQLNDDWSLEDGNSWEKGKKDYVMALKFLETNIVASIDLIAFFPYILTVNVRAMN